MWKIAGFVFENMAGNITIIEPKSNYQRVSKEIIFNQEVDALTLGVYVKVLCLGKKWRLDVQGLAKALGVSADKIRHCFAILEGTGYLRRTRAQGANGRFKGWDYEICSEPLTDISKTPTSVKSDIGKNRPSENGEVYNKIYTQNKDIYSETKTDTIPPTPQEVVDYCREQGFRDPIGFADYYLRCQTANQWRKKSGEPIVNWKLNIQQWRKYHKDETFPAPSTSTPVAKTDFYRLMK